MKIPKDRTILISYILSFFYELYFPTAIWIFFYLKYLTFEQIALLSAARVIFSVIFEIPTGALADMMGRRMTVAVSFFLYALTMLLQPWFTAFAWFFMLAIFKSLSEAFYSGSLESLVYDHLKEKGQEEQYKRVVSHQQSLVWLGLFVASVIGGFLYGLWIGLPYIVTGIGYTIAGLCALLLAEPKIHTTEERLTFKQYFWQNFKGFNELFKTPHTIRWTLLLMTLGTVYVTGYSILGISQLKEYGASAAISGIIFGIGYLIAAGVSQFYPTMVKKLGEYKLLTLTAIVLIVGLVFAKYVGVAIGCILIVARIASSTTFQNLKSTLVNSFIDSKNRATALSTLSLLIQLPYALAALFIGKWIDQTSPNTFSFYLGVVLIGALLIQLGYYLFVKTRSLSKPQKGK